MLFLASLPIRLGRDRPPWLLLRELVENVSFIPNRTRDENTGNVTHPRIPPYARVESSKTIRRGDYCAADRFAESSVSRTSTQLPFSFLTE